jgi:chemotaxis protein CheD
MMVTASLTHSVGLGMLVVVKQCEDLLVARGLGSCIGIAAYEPGRRIAALAHVMLPGPAPETADPEQPARYAAQAVDSLIRAVEQHGGRRSQIRVKLAGGAQVIQLNNREDRLQVGLRNIEAVRAALVRTNLPILAEDVGGKVGRTLTLYAASGDTTVRLVGAQEKPL